MLCPLSSFSTMLEVLFFGGRIVSIVLQNFLGLFWFLFNSSFMNSDLAWVIALFALFFFMAFAVPRHLGRVFSWLFLWK